MFTTLVLAMVLSTSPNDTSLLIRELGSDSYQERQAAEEKLIKIGRPALDPCRQAIKNTTDPEIRTRCKRVINSFYFVLNSDGYLPNPSQFDDDISAEIRKALNLEEDVVVGDHYRKIAEKKLPPYDDFVYGTWYAYVRTCQNYAIRLMIVDLLESGWEPDKVQSLLDRMSLLNIEDDENNYYESGGA